LVLLDVEGALIPPIVPLTSHGSQTGPAADGVVHSPIWSYSLGLENGFMPTDPRDSHSVCAALKVDA
jgi:hypothetical protein